jgi:hypothetical protein
MEIDLGNKLDDELIGKIEKFLNQHSFVVE